MTERLPVALRALPTILLASTLLAGCARAEDPADQAQRFWDALAGSRLDDARDLVISDAPERQRRHLDTLAGVRAEVEDLAVPEEAAAAFLPTRARRGSDGSTEPAAGFDMLTVLRRTDAGWRVDLEDTVREYRRAAAEETGERLADALGRLGDTLGRGAGDFGEALEGLGRDLGALIEREGEAGAAELESELSRRLEAAGDALARGLEELERALEEAGAEARAKADAEAEAERRARDGNDSADEPRAAPR